MMSSRAQRGTFHVAERSCGLRMTSETTLSLRLSLHLDLQCLELLAPEGVLVDDELGKLGPRTIGRQLEPVLGQRLFPLGLLHRLLGVLLDLVEDGVGRLGWREQPMPAV